MTRSTAAGSVIRPPALLIRLRVKYVPNTWLDASIATGATTATFTADIPYTTSTANTTTAITCAIQIATIAGMAVAFIVVTRTIVPIGTCTGARTSTKVTTAQNSIIISFYADIQKRRW